MNIINNNNEKITAGAHIPYWIESTTDIEYDGKVLNGPANIPLVAYQQKFDLGKAMMANTEKPVLK